MAMIRWAKLGHSDQVVAPTAARTREQSSIEPGGPLGGRSAHVLHLSHVSHRIVERKEHGAWCVNGRGWDRTRLQSTFSWCPAGRNLG